MVERLGTLGRGDGKQFLRGPREGPLSLGPLIQRSVSVMVCHPTEEAGELARDFVEEQGS